MKTCLHTCMALVIFFLLPAGVLAQFPISPPDTTLTGDELEEITVTAFRSPYNLSNTPAPVNLIPTRQFEVGSALSTVNALNQVPGVLMHHGTLNTNRLTIRGIGSRTPYATNKIKAYFGEIPLTSGDGETTLEDLENTGIQRAEIIKGPASSLYGAGLAGVILFHPKTVVKDFISNQTTVGSFQTLKNTLTAGINTGQLKVYALGSVLSSDGYRENNNTNRSNFLLNSMYSFSEKSNLQFLIKATKMKAYIPSSLDWETFQEAPESAAGNWAAVKGFEEYTTTQGGLSFNRYTANDGKISLAAFGSLRRLDELRPFNTLDEESNYGGVRAYIQKIISNENNRFVFTTGMELFRERYTWKTLDNEVGTPLSDNKEKRQYENLFVQMESSFRDRLFISAGINGNLTRFKYIDNFPDNGDQSGKRNYQPEISPRIGVNYRFSDNFSAFANVSHGFSTPTFEETLMPDGAVNPDIKPESGWSFETGFRAQFTNRFNMSASYYRIYVNDLLVARRTGEDAYVGVNAGKSLHPGLEANVNWIAITHNDWPLLSVNGSATLANYHFKDFMDEGGDYSDKLLPGTAKEIFTLGANLLPNKNFSLYTWYRFNGEMPVDDANSDFSDAYGITNVEVKYKGEKGKIKLEVKTGIQNVFDVHYASMLAVNAPSFGGRPPRYYYPGNPRNYYVSFVISWVNE